MADDFLPSVRPIFRAVSESVVPESATMSAPEWAAFERIVERAIAARPPRLRRQLRLFLHALQIASLARHGRTLGALDPARRLRLLERVQDSRTLALRRGMWGVRTLILMGYYARPGVGASLGYRASRAGWTTRGTGHSVPLPPTEVWVEPA